MHDLRERQIEFLVEKLQPRQAARHQARAVIAAPARDDLLLFGPVQHIVVIPDQLDIGFIGVRTAKPVIDLGHACRRALDDHF